MPHVIQVRGVPDEVHEALVEAAASSGLSLTKYLAREFERIAARSRAAEHNAEVIRRTRARIRASVSRDDILAAIDEGRDDRWPYSTAG